MNALDAARRIRGKVVEMSFAAGTPHLGSSLSCADILAAAYWGPLRLDPSQPDDPDRDVVILSKGHAVSALYAALAFRGYFPESWLGDFCREGGRLPEHPSPRCVPGVEWATGSLGHGLPVGLGMALGARLEGRRSRVVVVMSDGECEEGSVWEAALLAPALKLDSVTAIVDFNKWQATGRSCEVMSLEPLKQKWESFGWSAHEVDGHDVDRLTSLLASKSPDGRPTAIVAHTVKGKGVSFMEDDNNWHYRIPKKEEVDAALRELGLR